MDRSQFDEEVASERLRKWVRWGAPDGTASDRVCVWFADGAWHLAITDERAVVEDGTRRTFAREKDALHGALRAARVLRDVSAFRA